jgi:hypothetical protein
VKNASVTFCYGKVPIANFILTDTLWPDFHPEDLDEAINEFMKRSRRYGDSNEKKNHHGGMYPTCPVP